LSGYMLVALLDVVCHFWVLLGDVVNGAFEKHLF